MKKLLFVCLIISCFSATAQDYHKAFRLPCNFEKKDSAYTFSDKNFLKREPNNDSKNIAALEKGELLVIDTTYLSPFDKNYVKPEFYKVKYKNKTAYISAEALAFKKVEIKKWQTYILFKLKNYKDSSNIAMREVYANTVVNEFETSVHGTWFNVNVGDTKGLDSVECLIEIDYLSEACGMEDGITYFTWSPNNIRELAHLSQVGDGGVYHYSEWLIFPADSGGVKGKIFYKSEMEEIYNEEESWIKKSFEERTYIWRLGEMIPAFKKEREY